MLAMHPAVVGGKEEVRVGELPFRLNLVVDGLHGLINSLQALYAVLVLSPDDCSLTSSNARSGLYVCGLIRDIRLVIRWVPGRLHAVEGIHVTRCRFCRLVRRFGSIVQKERPA